MEGRAREIGKVDGCILKYTMQDALAELVRKYTRVGHPSADELIAAQGLTFPSDPAVLLGGFWPEEESIDDFLAVVREWRGHAKTDPAA
jgi:hypothetical protein